MYYIQYYVASKISLSAMGWETFGKKLVIVQKKMFFSTFCTFNICITIEINVKQMKTTWKSKNGIKTSRLSNQNLNLNEAQIYFKIRKN